MKLIIDISEELYAKVPTLLNKGNIWIGDVLEAVKNGTPLEAQPTATSISDKTIIEYAKNRLAQLDKALIEMYMKGYEFGLQDWFKSKTQPCEDCVSREEVQDLISIWLSDYLLDETREALETINYKVGDMPSVTPERPKGKWIDVNGDKSLFECNKCGDTVCCANNNYCPNCGAEMEDEL